VSDDHFLSRWSKRKHEARTAPEKPPEAKPAPAANEAVPAVPEKAQPEPLPPIESLTPESDFSPFMKGDVDPGLRREALKTLFKDPRFNVMDGLDVYIDDYSKPDPLPPGWLEKIAAVSRLGDYRPPEPAKEALEAPVDVPAEAGKIEAEQPVAQPPLDTPEALPVPPESKQS
jgi:hypothetical protein